jgi:hypothetical protein
MTALQTSELKNLHSTGAPDGFKRKHRLYQPQPPASHCAAGFGGENR